MIHTEVSAEHTMCFPPSWVCLGMIGFPNDGTCGGKSGCIEKESEVICEGEFPQLGFYMTACVRDFSVVSVCPDHTIIRND